MIKLHPNKKCDVIAHTLTSCGIPIWQDIPEKIIADLKRNGYKIKKSKKNKIFL
jgi:hypothetical protein